MKKIGIISLLIIFFIGGNIFAIKNTYEVKSFCENFYFCENIFLNGEKNLEENKISVEKLEKILGIIQEKGYETENLSDEKKLEDNLLIGLVKTLDDPYSSFMPAEISEEFHEEMAGNFEGIGAELQMKDEVIMITSPLKGSPALESGLMPQDIILKVNGEDILGQNLSEVVKKIRGPKGTKVILNVYRKSELKTLDIEITRDTIHINSVKYELKKSPKGENVGYISINQFGDKTIEEFFEGLENAQKDSVKYLVLDLRFNGGGYLDGAVWIASPFLENGSLITKIKSKEGDRDLKAIPFSSKFPEIPMAILINGGSASASEIVSGALRDYKKAILVGENSFGKGSVQELVPFSDGSNLRITTAKWFTPNGQNIHEDGISPDIEIGRTFEDMIAKKDPQLDKAIEVLESGELENFYSEKISLTGSSVLSFNSSGVLITELEEDKKGEIIEKIFGEE